MPPPPPLPADDSLPAIVNSVEALASFSDMLADFLDQWNALLVEANSIAAALPPLADPDPEPEPSPKPVPVADPGNCLSKSSSVLVEAAAAAAAVPVADLVAESSPKPDPAAEDLLHPRNRVPADAVVSVAATASPLPDPVPESKPEPALSAETEPVLSAVVKPNHVPEPEPEPAPKPKPRPAAGRERRAGEPSATALATICEQMGSWALRRFATAHLQAEARVAALSWRSRIVREKGRVADASTRDGRGLILLMAAFGVPPEFPVQEVCKLLLAGDCLACAEVLKCSQLFVKKLRDVVADMLNRGSYCEAIGVIFAFELQNVFPLADILTYIVERVEQSRKDQEREGQCSLAGSKEHDVEELLLWTSISKCVEKHTPCSSEMSCFSIAERIKVLEERIGKPSQTTPSL